ncbi:RND transporter [Candidatus Magnetomorum sp. HK-1]|nr:RND transporter [Candidatus Magnetomorum sp. HK-1]
MKTKNLSVLIILTLLSCSACSFFKEKVNPPFAPGEIPQKYSIPVPKKKPTGNFWSQPFNDDELKQIVDRALSKNLSLKAAWAKLMQAKVQAIVAGSTQWPNLTANFDPALTKNRTNISGTGTWHNDFSLGLMSSFEIDFWGKIRAQKQSALLELEAVGLDYQTAMISMISEIALCWVDIISQRMQENLLNNQLETNQTYLKLVKLRFRRGMVSVLDVYQQQQVIKSIISQIPLIKAQEQLCLNYLAILCGEPPQKKIPVHQKTLPKLSKLPSTGVPSDLLESRPDIQASWSRLNAANKNVWVAKANQLPSLKLTASGNLQSDKFTNLFDFWFVRLAGNLAAPILDGGRRKAETQKARTIAYQGVIHYRNTVYAALKEVEDSLVMEKQYNIHLIALKQEKQTAQKALIEARNRYNKGLNNYLPVLTQTLIVQRLEREIIQKEAQCIRYRIQLYRALGGRPPFQKSHHLLIEE